MSQHASDVRTARVLFLAADPSKIGGVDVVPNVRSLMHVLFARNDSGQVYSTGILHSQGLSAIGGRENGMTWLHTNLYKSASTVSHRRRHIVVDTSSSHSSYG